MNGIIKFLAGVFLLGAILGVLSGCCKSTIDISEEVDYEEIGKLHDTFEDTDIYVKPEPLVKRELTYNGDGILVDVNDYMYDSENHLIENLHRIVEDGSTELQLYRTSEYSYSDGLCYEDVVNHMDGNVRTLSIYDKYGRDIQAEFVTDGKVKSINTTFEDIEHTYGTWKYRSWVTEPSESTEFIKKYDIYGNETYSWTAYKDDITETKTSYYYDSECEGRILLKEFTMIPNLYYRTEYKYDGDLLSSKTTTRYICGSRPKRLTEIRITHYEYDENNRLVMELSNNEDVNESGESELQSRYIIVYKYEEESDADIEFYFEYKK